MTTRLVDDNNELLRLTGGEVSITFHIREIKNYKYCAECSTSKYHKYEKMKSGKM